MNDNVFAVFKISYNPVILKAEGGICGTCFFINESTFIAGNHYFNRSLFIPKNGYEKVRIFLINDKNEIFQDPIIHKLHPKFDLALGTIKKQKRSNWIILGDNPKFSTGDAVYNLGYSFSSSLKEYNIRIANNEITIESICIELIRQDGIIKSQKNLFVNSVDIKLENIPGIILNYTSEVGFSGGPLFSTGTNMPIGFMSMLIPKPTSFNKEAIAIPITTVKQLIC